jgi:hypothetical protein
MHLHFRMPAENARQGIHILSTDIPTGTRSRAACGKVWRGRLTLLLSCLQTHVGTAAGSVGNVIKNKVYLRPGS